MKTLCLQIGGRSPSSVVKRVLCGILTIACVSCTGSLNPFAKKQDSGDEAALLLLVIGGPSSDNTLICATSLSGGTRTTQVKATSSTQWVYCDLSSLSAPTVTQASSTWDMRFQRFKIGSNSGTSGPGSGGTCDTGQADFAAVVSASVCVTAVDSHLSGGGAGGAASEWEGSAAMLDWYAYDGNTHVLAAKTNVYLVRSSDAGTFYKVQMLDYYDQAGTSGYPKFRYEIVN